MTHDQGSTSLSELKPGLIDHLEKIVCVDMSERVMKMRDNLALIKYQAQVARS
jgi:hypothetical protein